MKTYDHLKDAEKITDKIQCTENKNSYPENYKQTTHIRENHNKREKCTTSLVMRDKQYNLTLSNW